MPRVIARATAAVEIARTLGPRWLLYRAGYAWRRRSGALERATPAGAWHDRPLTWWLDAGAPSDAERWMSWRTGRGPAWLADAPPSPDLVGDGAVVAAEAILRGTWRFFSDRDVDLGFPPDWHVHALTGLRGDDSVHWSRLEEASAGDVKWIWEPSRFGCAFDLARAFARTGDERYAEAFWTLVDHWRRHNPPMRGHNWLCGQEAAFRVMAWCFAWHACASARASTPERVAGLVASLAWHAERIERNIDYAISQRNNHGISEGVGLWTVALVAPELRDAPRWRARGREVIEAEVRRQILPGGAYVQHSTNYHRVMLHDLAWALRLGERAGQPLHDDLRNRVLAAADWLAAFVDPATGEAPNYGANDGALVLPLCDSAFADFRPVVQLARAVCDRARTYAAGPWDEATAWFGLGEPLEARAPSRPPPGAAGYFLAEGPSSRVFVRCAGYDTRPSHADQLHVDLWWRGAAVALDGGTHGYTAEPPWDNALARTGVHNTVSVDDRDQMTRFSRFLWLDWAQGSSTWFDPRADGLCFVGEHDGYRALGIGHRRSIWRHGDAWVIVDDVLGRGTHRCRLQWLLADVPCRRLPATPGLDLELPGGTIRLAAIASCEAAWDVVRGGTAGEPVRGWRSRTYGRLDAAPSLALVAESALPVRFVTGVAEAGVPLELSAQGARVADVSFAFGPVGGRPPAPGSSAVARGAGK